MSPYEIEVLPELPQAEAWQDVVREAAVAALADQDQEPAAGCTILLTSDEHVHGLNLQFLGIDRPTDVLSFPSGEPMPGVAAYLGDIAISAPAAERQAKSGGHSVVAELQLLTVHAVLHLLGYDHEGEADKAIMWAVQARILGKLGAEITGPVA